MNVKLVGLLALSVLAARPLYAEGLGDWAAEYRRSFQAGEAQAFAAHRPAPFALDLALRLGEAGFAALDCEDAARLALRLAVSIDTDLRFGRTFQEAGARSAQLARLLIEDAVARGDGSVAGLWKMRSRSAEESARARAGSLADPLGRNPASFAHSWARR